MAAAALLLLASHVLFTTCFVTVSTMQCHHFDLNYANEGEERRLLTILAGPGCGWLGEPFDQAGNLDIVTLNGLHVVGLSYPFGRNWNTSTKGGVKIFGAKIIQIQLPLDLRHY